MWKAINSSEQEHACRLCLCRGHFLLVTLPNRTFSVIFWWILTFNVLWVCRVWDLDFRFLWALQSLTLRQIYWGAYSWEDWQGSWRLSHEWIIFCTENLKLKSELCENVFWKILQIDVQPNLLLSFLLENFVKIHMKAIWQNVCFNTCWQEDN